MTSTEIYYLVGGLVVGLLLGWLFWRFRTLSRDQASALESRATSAERRLERTTSELTESESNIVGLESQLADERKIFEHALVGELVTDEAAAGSGLALSGLDVSELDASELDVSGLEAIDAEMIEVRNEFSLGELDGSNEVDLDLGQVDSYDSGVAQGLVGEASIESSEPEAEEVGVLAERLSQSQTWLDEAHQRIEALEYEADQGRVDQDHLLGRVETSEAKLDQTRRALVEADSQVNNLTSRMSASEEALTSARRSIKKIRRHVKSANSAVVHGLAEPSVIDLRDDVDSEQSEVEALVGAGSVAGSDGSMLALVDANGRLIELESELSSAHAQLERVADAPERAQALASEVEVLKSRVADQQRFTNELEVHIGKREEIDQRLDTMFVEIHELRGRSAAVRSELHSGEA